MPFKLKFDPETVHMCTKLSGVVAAYSTKEKFDSILHFLSKRFVVHSLSNQPQFLPIQRREHLQARTCFGGKGGKESEFNVRVTSVKSHNSWPAGQSKVNLN